MNFKCKKCGSVETTGVAIMSFGKPAFRAKCPKCKSRMIGYTIPERVDITPTQRKNGDIPEKKQEIEMQIALTPTQRKNGV